MNSDYYLTLYRKLFLISVCIITNTMISAQQDETILNPPSFPKELQLSDCEDADYSWRLQTLDGDTVFLSEFENKVIIINLWTTWCALCVSELKYIQNLYNSLEGEDVVFLIISDQESKIVQNFLDKNDYYLPFYLQEPWWLDKIPGIEFVFTGGPKVFKTWGIPTTFIINRDGKIVFKYMGAAKWDDDPCLRFIRSLL